MSRIKEKIISNFDYSKKNYLKDLRANIGITITPKKQIYLF